MISLTDVSKSYGSSTVLGPVDLEIPAGGITALVGPNGAGKSTLLTIVGRLTDPTTGRVSVGGLDVARAPSRELARTLSILRQENHFITRLTVRELVGFGRFPHSQGRLTADDVRHIDHAIDFLDLGGLEGRVLDELSGGQRQRAYVAMVLAQDTDYVLLDEPLNNLDMSHSVAMMKQLRKAADELGKTFIVVIHDINFAAAYADRIIALAEGRVVHNGTPAEIMTPATLESIFHTPIEVRTDGEYPVAVYFR
ncbi:iron ABC transporter ATP-binding protein [Agromyces atrinae]|uniref:ATP-binding cassette domain-containing protein n=1 Tax=Agromyces atrinae TaxID=592376 RepID=A0A4Q2M7Z8_9MICO|nr:ATP-binding cassette domain-containing protein [Agromyces atrinae]NYD67661.1 iron complex transport system ATP-binding protein [Agromyces atrinae]RXZ88138.1 ATP-binding cassette domain-containing protein [Agromyces atrinae]